MDFTTMGTVGSYIKQKNLFFAANYKIKTGQRVVDSTGNLNFAKPSMMDQILEAQKKSTEEVDAARISSIKQKLMSGRKLTNEEMGYLREKDPKMYKKAKHAEEAREELKSQLKKAKTKQEARQALTQAMVKASAEASAELAAYKDSIKGGGMPSGAGYQAGTEVGGNVGIGDSAANLDGVSAENLSSADSPSLLQVNQEISADGEELTGAVSELTKLEIQSNQDAAEDIQQANEMQAEENSEDASSNSNSPSNATSRKISMTNSATDMDSPQDIMEKFIMTIRALEDEWAQFTKSKAYDEMPEDFFEEDKREKSGGKKYKNTYKAFDTPSKKVLDVISVYRSAMMFQPAKS